MTLETTIEQRIPFQRATTADTFSEFIRKFNENFIAIYPMLQTGQTGKGVPQANLPGQLGFPGGVDTLFRKTFKTAIARDSNNIQTSAFIDNLVSNSNPGMGFRLTDMSGIEFASLTKTSDGETSDLTGRAIVPYRLQIQSSSWIAAQRTPDLSIGNHIWLQNSFGFDRSNGSNSSKNYLENSGFAIRSNLKIKTNFEQLEMIFNKNLAIQNANGPHTGDVLLRADTVSIGNLNTSRSPGAPDSVSDVSDTIQFKVSPRIIDAAPLAVPRSHRITSAPVGLHDIQLPNRNGTVSITTLQGSDSVIPIPFQNMYITSCTYEIASGNIPGNGPIVTSNRITNAIQNGFEWVLSNNSKMWIKTQDETAQIFWDLEVMINPDVLGTAPFNTTCTLSFISLSIGVLCPEKQWQGYGSLISKPTLYSSNIARLAHRSGVQNLSARSRIYSSNINGSSFRFSVAPETRCITTVNPFSTRQQADSFALNFQWLAPLGDARLGNGINASNIRFWFTGDTVCQAPAVPVKPGLPIELRTNRITNTPS
jgi:hypothetical protein